MVRRSFFSAILLLLLMNGLSGCSSWMYYPRIQKIKFHDPSEVGLHQTEVEFEDRDGTRLHGWWFDAHGPAKGTLVFFHGNAQNLTTHFLNLAWLPDRGYNYFIFDYPGYGVSEGSPSPHSTWLAGLAALRWVHQNKDASSLIIFGQSLGGNIAFRTALDLKDEIPIRAIILDSTFLSYKSIARRKAAQNTITWIFQPLVWLTFGDMYAPQHIERRAGIPLLVIRGDLDQVVPPDFGDRIFSRSPEPKALWKLPTGHHGDVFWIEGRKYRQQFVDYLDNLK